MIPTFQTKWLHEKTPPEINSGECITETAGYVTAQQRIETMILAGQRLVDYRKHQFDFQPEEQIDESFEDPTRLKNLDPAEATQLQYSSEARIKASQKRQDDLRKLETTKIDLKVDEIKKTPE